MIEPNQKEIEQEEEKQAQKLPQSASGDPFSHKPSVNKTEFCPRPDIPAELPSIIMGNVKSLCNNMKELTALTQLQREYQECSLMMFTESWLKEQTPDWLVTLDRFHLVRADRSLKDTGKKRGGGLVMYVNERWCSPEKISTEKKHFTKDVELLAVSLQPYHLPKQFSYVIAITVYIAPSANAAAARELICSEVCQQQRSHPQSLIIISGDFNHKLLSTTLPTFSQYVDCPTRGNDTLDLLYANAKDAYRSSPLPPLGRSDHNLVRLQPIYIPVVKKQPPTIRYVKNWSEKVTEAVQGCFKIMDWDVLCGPHSEDIDNMIQLITDYIGFCVELKALLKKKRWVFECGNKEELSTVKQELERKFREGKASCKTKTDLQQNIAREI